MKHDDKKLDEFLSQLLKKQKKDKCDSASDEIDFDLLSAYVENSLQNDETYKIEEQITNNACIGDLVNSTREFLENENLLENVGVYMKKSSVWTSDFFRCAATFVVIAISAVFVAVFVVDNQDLDKKTKRIKIYRPKRTRSITQPQKMINKTNLTEVATNRQEKK